MSGRFSTREFGLARTGRDVHPAGVDGSHLINAIQSLRDVPQGLKSRVLGSFSAVRAEALTYQSCPDTVRTGQMLYRTGGFRFVVSHPSRKNKSAARVGHPAFSGINLWMR